MKEFMTINSNDQVFVIRIAKVQHVCIHVGGIELHMDNAEVIYIQTKDQTLIEFILKELNQKEIA